MRDEQVFQIVRLNDYGSLANLAMAGNLNLVNEDGQSLLHEASAYKSFDCAKILIGAQVNLDFKDTKGQTALHYCAAGGALDIAEIIVDAGADISLSDKFGNEPLWTAVFNARGKYEMVEFFIRAGSDPDHKNNSRKSPIDFARQINDVKMLAVLNN